MANIRPHWRHIASTVAGSLAYCVTLGGAYVHDCDHTSPSVVDDVMIIDHFVK